MGENSQASAVHRQPGGDFAEPLGRHRHLDAAAWMRPDGTLMKGVRFFGDGIRTTSLVMQTHPHRIRFIDSIHVQAKGSTAKIRF